VTAAGAAAPTTLERAEVARVLDRLHAAARGDWRWIVPTLPRALWTVVSGTSFMKTVPPSRFKGAYLPVSRAAGRFLYLLARATAARNVVEFGTSFGISAIYLAAAVRDGGGGLVTTTEIEPSKCAVAAANLQEAGLADLVRILEGDVRDTLKAAQGPIDLLFLDGWKDLYVPVLELLRPRLRRGALVVADNVNFPDSRPYARLVRAPGSGFVSTTHLRGSLEVSCLVG
jgi:predicted O-methyltransferase YrrM